MPVQPPSSPAAWTALIVDWAMEHAIQPDIGRFLLRRREELHARQESPAVILSLWHAVHAAWEATPTAFQSHCVAATITPLVGAEDAAAFATYLAEREHRRVAGTPSTTSPSSAARQATR